MVTTHVGRDELFAQGGHRRSPSETERVRLTPSQDTHKTMCGQEACRSKMRRVNNGALIDNKCLGFRFHASDKKFENQQIKHHCGVPLLLRKRTVFWELSGRLSFPRCLWRLCFLVVSHVRSRSGTSWQT